MRGCLVFRARVLFALVFVAAAVAGARSAARADCGMHAFQTVSVPALRKMEALPLSPQNVLRVAGDFNSQSLIQQAGNFVPAACSDEPPMRNAVAHTVANMWSYALSARAKVAALQLVENGQTTAPPACLAYAKIAARAGITGDFAFAAPRDFNEADSIRLARNVEASPYYAHIRDLWTAILRSIGLKYPGIGTTRYPWATPFAQQKRNAEQHLPSGLLCQDPELYYPRNAGER
jgi:hypothetical protein